MNFEDALKAMREGRRVTRDGTSYEVALFGGAFERRPVDRFLGRWREHVVATHELLAEDWRVVGDAHDTPRPTCMAERDTLAALARRVEALEDLCARKATAPQTAEDDQAAREWWARRLMREAVLMLRTDEGMNGHLVMRYRPNAWENADQQSRSFWLNNADVVLRALRDYAGR